ncbi:small subunit rRNA synthesis-associated protein, putative [Plasmodium malariae]|uniref:Small subunit rRNA synthesis-associated protein, putative n=1 Tax=Plasmodium malariae TaxID=5858 RepID=A0A1C3KY45_PLAMA|nr:small subunit rRNA synthesis-associated protein, putative [Plasmodium malariae]
MNDSFEMIKLCGSDHVSSHLIKIGSFNILCDMPLNHEEILNLKKKDITRNNSDREKELDEQYISITNMEVHSSSNKLLLSISNIPIKIHIILISCIECFMGLPIFCKYFDISDTHIICTKPIFTFSMCAVENLQTKENYLPEWNEEITETNFNENIFNSSDDYFDLKLSFKNSLHLLSYKEKISFKQNDEIVHITLYSSGYSLGSCNFFIATDFLNILVINKSTYNIKRHPSPFDSSCLSKADFVLFTSYYSSNHFYNFSLNQKEEEHIDRGNKPPNSYNDKLLVDKADSKRATCSGTISSSLNGNTPEQKGIKEKIKKKVNVCIERTYKDSLNKICSIVLRTIKSKGCVIIPVDLHFLYFLELVELIGVIISKYLTKEEQVLIFGIISNISNVIHQADLCAEWVEESRKKKCSKSSNPQGPFSIDTMIKNNRLIIGNDTNDICKYFRYPCVCFIQDSTLRFFESSVLLEKWAKDSNNSIILVDPYYDPISVLYPFHIYHKNINAYYCPLLWDINERNILDIINANTNKKCVYVLPHTLRSMFKKDQSNWEIYPQNVHEYCGPNKNDTPEGVNTVIPNNPDEHDDKRDINATQNSRTYSYTSHNIKNNVIYLYPLKKREIVFNSFLHFHKKMHPIRFTVDGTQKLEKVLRKIDDFYCANVKCTYLRNFFGDIIKEDNIEELIDEDKDDQKEKKDVGKKTIINEIVTNERKIGLMFGSINEQEILNNLVQYGYSKNDLTINYSQNIKLDVDQTKYLWCIEINSINSKIIGYTKYDIEVFSSNTKLRQQITEILHKLSKSF